MILEDTYLIPFLQIKKVSVKPFFNERSRLCFEVPEEASELITEFYAGNPRVSLSDYVTRLKQTRCLLFSLRKNKKAKGEKYHDERKEKPPESATSRGTKQRNNK